MGKHSKLSNIFHNMKARCYNPSNKDYKNYGARGITICSEWLNTEKAHESNCTKGFIAFKQWAIANGYSEELTLDRINVNGSYSPNNCRWVSRKIQQNNMRRNCFVYYKGRTQTLAQWCSELKLNYHKTVVRINQLGWSPERAFKTS